MLIIAGLPATIGTGSDCHPATVVNVWKKGAYCYVEVQEDNFTVVAGSEHDGSAEYEYAPNPKGNVTTFRFNMNKENQRWVRCYQNESGRWVNGGDFERLSLGNRRRYYDPHF